jgi:hypothetical protein
MAQSKNNTIAHGLSGKVGDLIVFRNVNGNPDRLLVKLSWDEFGAW